MTKQISRIREDKPDKDFIQSPLEDFSDSFGAAIMTFFGIFSLIAKNSPEGKLEGLLYVAFLVTFFQCIHFLYNKFFEVLVKVLNKGSETKDGKKVPSKK